MTWQELMLLLRTLSAVEGYLSATVDTPPEWIVEQIDKCVGMIQQEMLKHTEVK